MHAGRGRGNRPDPDEARTPLQVFISFLAHTANDVAKEKKRQTIQAEDIFSALEDLDFGEFLDPLKEFVEGEPPRGVRAGGRGGTASLNPRSRSPAVIRVLRGVAAEEAAGRDPGRTPAASALIGRMGMCEWVLFCE